MDELLLLIFRKGGGQPVPLSTSALGRALGMSQQNASRRLIALEEEGLLVRKSGTIILTPKALGQLGILYHGLRQVFEGHTPLQFRGRIVRGFGEGAYYLSLPGYEKALVQKLEFRPYPGTLNLRLDKKSQNQHAFLRNEDGLFIPGFKWENRQLGGIYVFPCRIGNIPGALLRPVRTHHGPDIIELVAAVSLKQKLKKKEGDWVKVKMR